MCSNCSSEILPNNKNNLCIFCNTLLNYTNINLLEFTVCMSNMPQKEICYKTSLLYTTSKTIPLITEVDPSAILINLSPYIFLVARKKSEDDKILNFYKIFFVENIFGIQYKKSFLVQKPKVGEKITKLLAQTKCPIDKEHKKKILEIFYK